MMVAQLSSELRKLTTTWSWWAIGAAMVLCTTALVAVLLLSGLHLEQSPLDLSSVAAVKAVYSLGAGITYVFTLVAGIVVVTGEYQTGTMAQTLLANPDRRAVYLSKVLAAALSGLVFGAATLAASVGTTAALLATEGLSPHLGESAVAQGLGGTVATLTLWAVIGAGLGALVRNQLVAVVAVVVLSQAVEPMLRIALPGGAADYLPSSIADAASGGTVMSLAMGRSALEQGTALILMLALTAAVALVGAHRFRRYQVT